MQNRFFYFDERERETKQENLERERERFTRTIAVISCNGVLGYQDGSTLLDAVARPLLPRRAVVGGVFSEPGERRARAISGRTGVLSVKNRSEPAVNGAGAGVTECGSDS